MNTGLKAHLFSTILYIIPIIFVLITVSNISDNIKYLFAFGYILLQIAIGFMAYLEDWYFNK